MNDVKPLHKFWWLWLPLAAYVIQIILELVYPGRTLDHLMGEDGPHELVQFIVLSCAFIVTTLTLIGMPRHYLKSPMILWLGTAWLATLYVAGEEISWAQHFLEWNTPEYWSSVNDQGETNLHNTTSWLDQKPRLLLEIGVLVGGVIMPLLYKFKPQALPQRFAVIYPPAYLSVIAWLALVTKISDKLGNAVFDEPFFYRTSEVIELHLYAFVLFYLIHLKRRLFAQK